VYIKFEEEKGRIEDIPLTTRGQVDYKHTHGEISHVRISAVGLGMLKVGISNLPPEVPTESIQASFSRCGLMREVQAETLVAT
jgi:hypothetical protein